MRITSVVTGLVCATLLTGCGSGTYESRMQQATIPYFKYRNEVDANLSAEWARDTLRFRVPKQFQEVLGGKPKDDERDPRQPEFLDADLPGLVAAWTAQIGIDTPVEPRQPGEEPRAAPLQRPTVQSYVYLLWNRAVKGSQGENFDLVVVNRILGGLGQSRFTSEGLASATNSKLVGVGDFKVEKRISQVGFRTEEIVDGVPMDIIVAFYQQRSDQVAMVYVVPQTANFSESIPKRIDLSIESLRVESMAAPVGVTPAGGEPAAPEGGGGPAF
ncbi:hypothetical protein [Stratiformator vulcanicus]|nr:hypothetical protein [Stratiformator vulcanicus]